MILLRQKSVLMRHLFLIVSCLVVMSCLLIVGFGLSSFFNDTRIADIFPGKNASAFVIWRIIFYCSALVLIQPLTNYVARKYDRSESGKVSERVRHYRIRLLMLIVLYEVFVVQNAVVQLIGVFL